ncbi:MAG: DUF3604 domain-containing protein [Pseudomonadota bacterium]
MPPIEPHLMGDVWPAAEPGSTAADYGSAALSPVAPVPVRSYQTLTITYTAGKFGLDDTGAIAVAMRWVQDGGPLQSSDPTAMNYIAAVASNGAPLLVTPEQFWHRPWGHAVRITVKGGFLREGDTITVTFGDRAGGSPGLRMQTIAESALEFRVSVDACATGHFAPLDERLSIPVVAGPLHRWVAVLPSLRRPGERFQLGLRAEDIWGNPAIPDDGTLTLSADHPVSGLPTSVTLPETGCLTVDGLAAETGTLRVFADDASGRVATSNPLTVQAGENAGYWGDLHGQSGESVGIGTISEYMDFARNAAFLEVSGHQANDFQVTNAFWQQINDTTAEMTEDGRFILFPGYEWSGNTPVGGDHNVFYRHEGRPIVRSSHAMLHDRDDLGTDANTLDALFTALREEDAVVWSHVGGRPADVGYAHDPALKTAVEVHSNWGTFEWILTDSLALGHRVGVVSNSDGHKGRPGAGPPGATEFGAYGGLTCFLAPELTRDALFECMRRRHHYGTSGSRIGLDVRASFNTETKLFPRDPRHFDCTPEPAREAMMGDIVHTADGACTFSVSVNAPAPVERIDVMRGAEMVHTERCYGAGDLGHRVRVYWQGAEYRGRGRNTFWRGEIRADGTTINAMVPVNHWNHERPLTLRDNRLAFEAITSGNFGGVDLALSGPGQLEIETNLVSATVDTADLGLEDHVLDAGGLERRLVIRRLPDELEETTSTFDLPVPLAAGDDIALWVRVTTLDGHQAWSSPIYVEVPPPPSG